MCANTTRPLVQWVIDWYTSAANKATAAIQKARAKSVGNTQAFVDETMQDALAARAEYARREAEAIPWIITAARAAQWLGRLALALGVVVGLVTFLVRILFDDKGPGLQFAMDRISRRPKEGGADITVGFDVYEELPLLSAQRRRELTPFQDWLYFPRGANAAGLGARTVALLPLYMAARRVITLKVFMERWHTGAPPLPPLGWRAALVRVATRVLTVLRRWEIAAPAPQHRADDLGEGGENEPSLSVPLHQVVAIRTTSDRDITFAFSDLVAFTEGVKISTVYSVHAATSLLETGRFLLMARGDGMIALRAVGKVEGGDKKHRGEQMCALLAWDTRQRFQMVHEHGLLGSWFNPPSVKAIGSLGVVTHGVPRSAWYPLRRLLALVRYILLPL